jgi:hypothetical protein
MTENYKVIKLRSGEELIAQIVASDEGKVTLFRPMVFKTIVMQDPMGIPREGIVLKNWLAFGNQKETTIPSDFIATTLEPTNDVMSYYLAEKERDDVSYQKTPMEEFSKEQKKQKKENTEDIEDMLSELFGSIFGEAEEDKGKSKKRKSKDKENIIHMSMVFSPEALAHMINEGMIDPRDIMDMIRHFELDKPKRKKKNNRESINDKKFTGDQKERKDFGNKWTDWNPDPNADDYK